MITGSPRDIAEVTRGGSVLCLLCRIQVEDLEENFQHDPAHRKVSVPYIVDFGPSGYLVHRISHLLARLWQRTGVEER